MKELFFKSKLLMLKQRVLIAKMMVITNPTKETMMKELDEITEQIERALK